MRRSTLAAHLKLPEHALEEPHVIDADAEEEQKEDASMVRQTRNIISELLPVSHDVLVLSVSCAKKSVAAASVARQSRELRHPARL